jgi:hypothetical protein
MSIEARPLYDERNAYTNPDGTLGFKCCGGNSSKPAYLINDVGIPALTANVRSIMVSNGMNPDEPYCPACQTALEQLRDELEEGGPAFVSMVATIASFIPGFGTAVAVVLQGGLALAEGEDITDAFIDGIKAAIPGGAISEAAFAAGQAALEGKDPEGIVLAGAFGALNLPKQVEDAISTGLQIMQSLAKGEPVAKVALDTAYAQLPDWGQRAVDIGMALKDGRSPAEIIIEQSQKMLPPYLQVAMAAGQSVGHAQALQSQIVPPGPTIALGRADISPGNDALARKGQIIGQTNSLTFHARAMASYAPQLVTTDAWRRGFDIGIATAAGHTLPGPGQDAVRKTLTTIAEMNGFDSARLLQYKIENERQTNMSMGMVFRVVPNTAAEESRNTDLSNQGLVIAMANPQVAAARALNTDPRYKYGFDIGTAAALGQTMNGPGKDTIRLSLGQRTPGPGALPQFVASQGGSAEAQQGFDTALQLQFGLAKGGVVLSNHPVVAAGQLVTSGMVGTGTSAAQKAGAMTAVVANPAAKAGATAVVAANTGFWAKLKSFFGL